MDRRFILALAAVAALAPPGAGAAARERPAAEDRIGPGWSLMNGDLVLVGPAADPARVTGLRDLAGALRRVAEARAPFVSRGDHSQAHEAELRLWRAAGVYPGQGRGRWYRELNRTGGAALLAAAAAQGAYALVERGDWLALRDRGGLRIVAEDGARLSR